MNALKTLVFYAILIGGAAAWGWAVARVALFGRI